jgi:hypothetical protein
MGAVKGMISVPHPENDSDAPQKKRRRPSHIRKRRKDSTTKVLRVRRGTDDDSDRGGDESMQGELWARVANDAPPLPDPPLHRRIPPPAPLPAEPLADDSLPRAWNEDRPRLRRIEEAVGIVGLAVLVAAMLVAMWLRMTGQ